MKTIKLIILIIASLILVNSATATTTFAEFENHLQTTSINQGQSISFDWEIFSVNPPISYSVKMYDRNDYLIKTYAHGTTNNFEISGTNQITQQDYQNPGIYRIYIYGIDAFGDASTSILTLNVNQIITNHDPVLNPIGNKEVNENELLSFNINAYDPDNDPMTLRAANLPEDAVIRDYGSGNWLFSWQTDYNDQGRYNLRFTVTDNRNGIDYEDVLIIVNDVQISQNPSIEILAPRENEVIYGNYNVRWNAQDPNQIPETLDIKLEYTYNGYDWVVLEDGVNNNDGTFSWNTLRLSDADDYKLRAIVKDDQNNIADDMVDLEINNKFSPNVNFIQPRNNEIISEVYDVKWNAHDLDQDPRTLDILLEYRGQTDNIIKNILRLFDNEWIILEESENNDGIFSWNTNTVENGEYELRIIATDDDNLRGTDYLSTIIINNVVLNHPPIIISDPTTTAVKSQTYNYDVDAIDQDNDPLTYSLVESPNGMIIEQNTGLITWTPSQIGTYLVEVKVQDPFNAFDVQQYNIIVSESEIIITPIIKAHVHGFNINNVILKYENKKLNAYSYIRNSGTEDEKIKLMATIMQNGRQEITSFNLDNNDNKYISLSFDNVKKGYYTVKVEAFNSKHYDVRYAYIRR